MKNSPLPMIGALTAFLAGAPPVPAQTSMDTYVASVRSWLTNSARQYARVRTNHTATTWTTWNNANMCQCLPVYADVHWIGYDLTSDSIYVRAPGLPSYTMGPWYLDAADLHLFPNLPTNQHYVASFPRHPARISALLTRSNTPVGMAGMFVNGTAVFNMLDGYRYQRMPTMPGDPDPNHGADVQGVKDWTTGVWHRNGDPSELASFDVNNSHQTGNGEIHQHVNPSGLRLQLLDNVQALLDPATLEITNIHEYAGPDHHSPILGWAFDGFPIYGPYGYSDPTNAHSTVRRMVSGYVLRNGQYGTSNLNVTGRTSLPVWALDVQGRSTTTLTNREWGPSTSKIPMGMGDFEYALGRYAEDYAYLGDLPASARVGVDWDLDACNQRFCVTPEFPDGIYAYFITIDSNGLPEFPFILGPQYCGKVLGAGSSGGSVPEGTTEIFNLYGDFRAQLQPPEVQRLLPDTVDVWLTWRSYEGGQYRILKSDNLQNWVTAVSSVTATGATTQFTFTQDALQFDRQFWRVALDALAPYDPDELPGASDFLAGGGCRAATTPVRVQRTAPAPPWRR
jgi:YHYH protein